MAKRRVIVTGPDDLLTTRPATRGGPVLKGSPATLATADIYDDEEAYAIISVNGEVEEVVAYEEVAVSEAVLDVLRNAGYEMTEVHDVNELEED